jgi:hypothetical protein
MTLKEIRKELANQISLVKSDVQNIPQAETIANLAGKTCKVLLLEIQANAMREAGKEYAVIADMIGK